MRELKLHLRIILAGLILIACSATHAADTKSKKKDAPKLRPYKLAKCIVSGQKLEADAYTFKYEDREIKTCCDQCMDDFYKDPPGYLEKIEAAEKKAGK